MMKNCIASMITDFEVLIKSSTSDASEIKTHILHLIPNTIIIKYIPNYW